MILRITRRLLANCSNNETDEVTNARRSHHNVGPVAEASNAAWRRTMVGRPFKAGNAFDRADTRRVATFEFYGQYLYLAALSSSL